MIQPAPTSLSLLGNEELGLTVEPVSSHLCFLSAPGVFARKDSRNSGIQHFPWHVWELQAGIQSWKRGLDHQAGQDRVAEATEKVVKEFKGC